MIVYLSSDLAADVNGQIFYVRGTELFLIQQCQALTPLNDKEGWTPAKIHAVAIPHFRNSFGELRGEDEKIIYQTKLG